jgi:PAS domain S-box-containing protein
MDSIKKKSEAVTDEVSKNSTEHINDEAYIRHLAAIVESSDDAIISKCLDGIIRSWNRGSERMFGYTTDQAVGKHISLIIPPEYINEEKSIWEKIRNNEVIDQYETIRNKKNGEHFHVALTISPLKDRFGNIIGISKIARDISASKQAEVRQIQANMELVFQNEEKEKRANELIIANKELAFQNEEKEKRANELIIANKELAFQDAEKAKRADELIIANKELAFQNEEKEKMVADIVQRSKNLEQFTYIISHNLRAPVAHILGISNVLKGELSDAERDRTHSYLFSAVEQLDNVIKDMAKILQMRSEITEDKVAVSFQELVDTIKLSIQNIIQKEKAEIVTDFLAIDTIVTLKGYFHSVFYNLILNAIKYKQPGTSPVIKIRTELQKGKIIISFKDNGTGIDLTLHGNKLFGLYNRFHSNIEGKGVGLFMVKTQIEVLGGNINVTSEPGKGTEFMIELPQ